VPHYSSVADAAECHSQTQGDRRMNIPKLLLLAMIGAFSITACDQNDGMAEKAGEAMDEVGEDVEKAATDAGNAIEDACEDAKKSAGAKDTDC